MVTKMKIIYRDGMVYEYQSAFRISVAADYFPAVAWLVDADGQRLCAHRLDLIQEICVCP